jgi:hypothetical protein
MLNHQKEYHLNIEGLRSGIKPIIKAIPNKSGLFVVAFLDSVVIYNMETQSEFGPEKPPQYSLYPRLTPEYNLHSRDICLNEALLPPLFLSYAVPPAYSERSPPVLKTLDFLENTMENIEKKVSFWRETGDNLHRLFISDSENKIYLLTLTINSDGSYNSSRKLIIEFNKVTNINRGRKDINIKKIIYFTNRKQLYKTYQNNGIDIHRKGEIQDLLIILFEFQRKSYFVKFQLNTDLGLYCTPEFVPTMNELDSLYYDCSISLNEQCDYNLTLLSKNRPFIKEMSYSLFSHFPLPALSLEKSLDLQHFPSTLSECLIKYNDKGTFVFTGNNTKELKIYFKYNKTCLGSLTWSEIYSSHFQEDVTIRDVFWDKEESFILLGFDLNPTKIIFLSLKKMLPLNFYQGGYKGPRWCQEHNDFFDNCACWS